VNRYLELKKLLGSQATALLRQGETLLEKQKEVRVGGYGWYSPTRRRFLREEKEFKRARYVIPNRCSLTIVN
jgi:hypothetical protein